MKEKRKIKVFISILLFATFIIACEAEQTAEVIEGAVIEEEEIIEVKEEVVEPAYLETYQEQNYPELRIAYKESTELIPEDAPMSQEVFISEWNLARIIIPKIDVDLIVLGGIDVFDKENMAKGPVHFGESLEVNPNYEGSLPNTEGGNVAIAGHRSGSIDRSRIYNYFLDLDFLEEGDEIYLDIEGYRFVYHVQWQKIVDRFDWSCLEPTDYPALTLQTCEPKEFDPNPEHRLMIRAGLHEVTRTPEVD